MRTEVERSTALPSFEWQRSASRVSGQWHLHKAAQARPARSIRDRMESCEGGTHRDDRPDRSETLEGSWTVQGQIIAKNTFLHSQIQDLNFNH